MSDKSFAQLGVSNAVVRALDERDPERERLARAGRGLGENVEAGERVRQDELLDCERFVELVLGERVNERRADAQRLERL